MDVRCRGRCGWVLACVALVVELACGPQLTRTSSDGNDEGTTVDPASSTSSGGPVTPGTTVDGTTTTTETSTEPTAETTVAASTSMSFIDPSAGCETEGGGAGSLAECDVWAQDCCAGDKCVAWANDGGTVWNATRCVPVSPEPNAPGEPCMVEGSGVSGIDDCDATSFCWAVDPRTLVGECVALCQGSEDVPVCRPGTDCFVANEGVLTLCLDRCDPLAPDCGAGQACVWHDGLPRCFPSVSVPEIGPGDPCDGHSACGEGLHCVSAASFPGCMGASCCSPYCDLLDPMPDAACMLVDPALGCTSAFAPDPAPRGLEHLGVCTG